MKLILTYTGPNKKFDNDDSVLVKIQIDNSFELGWKKEDILLVTDFPYEYNGMKSQVLGDGFYYAFDKTSNKVPVIMHLAEQGVLKKGEIYWYHDFDVYQQEVISENELGLTGFDLGLTPYGYKPQWNLGSFFFKESAKDIFNLINDYILHRRTSDNRVDEKAMQRIIYLHAISRDRYKDLNVTYNFTKRCIETNYRQAVKPLKVVHFHPYDRDGIMTDTALNRFMYSQNRLDIPLMNNRLIKIFVQHGIK
jgi:hypothetical protein